MCGCQVIGQCPALQSNAPKSNQETPYTERERDERRELKCPRPCWLMSGRSRRHVLWLVSHVILPCCCPTFLKKEYQFVLPLYLSCSFSASWFPVLQVKHRLVSPTHVSLTRPTLQGGVRKGVLGCKPPLRPPLLVLCHLFKRQDPGTSD